MSIKKPKHVEPQGGVGMPDKQNNPNYFVWAVGIILFIFALLYFYSKFV